VTEVLAASLLDMDWHTLTEPKLEDVTAFGNASMAKWGLIPEILPRYRTTYFLHSADEYSAGYYSYTWSAVLDADAFPPLFVATAGMDPAHARLVHDYHAWQAPWMLLLPHLDPATRSTLEAAACRQAESVEKHCRLYPAMIDRAALQAARVEAALVRSQPRPNRQDEVMPMFYIELNVSEE